MPLKCSCERRFSWKTHTNALAELAALRCAQGSIAASESATAEIDQAGQWSRTEAAIQALSLTQLNGMPYLVDHRYRAGKESYIAKNEKAWRK